MDVQFALSVVPVHKLIRKLQNLGPETGYPEWGGLCFSSVFLADSVLLFHVVTTSFLIHYSLIILPLALILQPGTGLDHPNSALFQL